MVAVETDHKPLEAIVRKALNSAPQRLQRMFLRLQRYNLEIRYKKGKEMFLADTLSRAFLPKAQVSAFVHELEEIDHKASLPVSDARWHQIENASADDPVFQELRSVIHRGWSLNRADVTQRLYPYFDIRDELTHDFAARPWSKVAADLCDLNGRTLLVISDYYSNYIEVARITSITSRSIIRELKAVFARFGIPEVFVTDNGAQFSSAEFAVFARTWGFDHVTSSPRYPESNGKAENAVKTIKRLFKKCKDAGQSEYLALLDWRNTPTEGIGTSPAQHLMGRRCRNLLPVAANLLKPRYCKKADMQALAGMKRRQQYYYNRATQATEDHHAW